MSRHELVRALAAEKELAIVQQEREALLDANAVLQTKNVELDFELNRLLSSHRELDLSKAHKHEHPDISADKTYLVKIHGGWFFGRFSRQWYGWNFTNWGSSGLQFDAPGWNSSTWEHVIELNPELLIQGEP